MSLTEETVVFHGDIEVVEITDDDDDDNEPPVIVRHTEKSSKKTGLVPCLNGYTKPSYSFPQLISKALALCPGRRASALSICDIIADMQPYYKYYSGNWKSLVYRSLITSKHIFFICNINENGEYIWSFNCNFENYDKKLPKKAKLLKQTDVAVESEVLRSPPTAEISNTKSSLVDSLEMLNKDSQSLCERSFTNNSSTFPTALQQFVTEGSQPLNRVTSTDPNFIYHNADLNQTISNTGADTQSGTGSSSSKSVPEFALADLDQLKDYQPDEIYQSRNQLESDVTITESLPDFETMRAVSSIITDFGKEINQELAHHTSDFSLNNLNHPQNISLSNEEMKYRAQFHKVHPAVEKFRIHCTVCDTHLGTAGLMAQENVRFHASLGVLTCKKCFANTKCISQVNDGCHWCSKTEGTHFGCSICPFIFCESCIDRNFGVPWRIGMTENKDWQCFLCDIKQLWPHRAVAYFLFCHYQELKKTKDFTAIGCYKYMNSEPPIFLNDLSTCCKKRPVCNTYKELNGFEPQSPTPNNACPPAASSTSVDASPKTFLAHSTLYNPLKKSNPLTSTEMNPSPDLQTDVQQHLIIENPSKNYVVVQAATGVSSLTVNTGTQYIHNIYPDKNGVYSQPSTANPQCAGINKVFLREMTKSSDPKNTSIHRNRMSINNTSLQVIQNDSTSENAIIVDDDDISIPTDPLSTQQSSKLMALQDKIKKKPMPKSKKQSLLRAVLMNESMVSESMKKHFQSNDLNTSYSYPESISSAVSNGENEEFGLNPNINVPSNTDQNSEEPILKSIIQTATERLLNIIKKPITSNNIDYGNKQSLLPPLVGMNESGDLSDNSYLCLKPKQATLNNEIPKIKIRPVEELQEHRPNCLGSKNELKCFNESNNIQLQKVDSNEIPLETNVTVLKESIIEASRTLVSTQKKFKELAKTISNKFTFQTGKATEMVTMFKDILQLCQKQISAIDSNITNKYCNIVHSKHATESVGVSTHKGTSQSNAIHLKKRKQKMKLSKLHFSRSVSEAVEDLEDVVEEINASNDGSNKDYHQPNKNLSGEKHENNINDEIPLKRKRELVDFNPFGKKTILGTPNITPEDLKEINITRKDKNHEKTLILTELAQRQKLNRRNLKKKNDVWSYKSRKRTYNKNNLIKRKIRCSIKNMWNKTEIDGDVLSKKQSNYNIEERLRERKRKFCRPLRSSDRKHSSSAALAASMLSLQRNVPRAMPNTPIGCVIKPCSVLVHKLEPRLVELMGKRVKKL